MRNALSGRLSAISCAAIVIVGIFLMSLGVQAQQQTPPTVSVTTVVTILGKNGTPPPAVQKNDINVSIGGKRARITDWTPAHNSPQGKLRLAILIDNDLRTVILGQQIQDLANFVVSLRPNVTVGIFYGEYGSATPAGPFGTDHQATAQMLRLSAGRGGDSPSIYLSLEDLASRWQSQSPAGGRREVLVLSSGFDPLYPGPVIENDPYFSSAVDKLQEAGMLVHTIWDGSPRYALTFSGDISQGKLIYISSQSGGQSYVEGTTPVSIAGYLNQLKAVFSNQFLLTFVTDRGNGSKAQLQGMKITLEQRGLKISYPQKVLIPGK